jgi:hypothetical protein
VQGSRRRFVLWRALRCLDPNAVDYDCEGGSGNGPLYTGTVEVLGVDHYGLDGDGDGIGCESE